ncbi:MAG: hypothetical protein ACYC7D_01280 [Nitrososphaerales archaeon]
MPHSSKPNYLPPPPKTKRSKKSIGFGIFCLVIIGIVMIGFTGFILNYLYANPNAFNPTPEYNLDIPLRFNYYYGNTPDYSGTPNFVFTIWLTGKTPVQNTILAGQPFTVSARADQANGTGSLSETRMISVFFQDSLAWPPTNDTDNFPNTQVTDLCQTGGDCRNCFNSGPNQDCYLVIPPNDNSQFFTSQINGTFYFPISGTYSPVIRFFTLAPNEKNTSYIGTAYPAQLGDISLQVQPASFAQEVYIGNASLVLTIAVFIFGAAESIQLGIKIANRLILKVKHASTSNSD